MHIRLFAIGRRMPDWVEAGFREYAQRFPRDCSLELHAIASPLRGTRAADPVTQRRTEAQALRAAMPAGVPYVALDEQGTVVDTAGLAARLGIWQQSLREVSLVIGGDAGLEAGMRDQAHWVWSLSPLTFPHMLVRVLVAEQLYRAWSLLQGHPYHRGN